MSKNLQLSLTMQFNGSAVVSGLDGVKRKVNEVGGSADNARRRFNEFGTNGKRVIADLNGKARELHASMNGFGVISQVAGAYTALAGASSMKSVISDNLEFERTLLSIRFNAQQTTKELAEMRKSALDLSKETLNSPTQILDMYRSMANAGFKNEELKSFAPIVAKSSQVFDTTPADIANLAYDLKTKFEIPADRMQRALDMIYFHGTSGRFETKDMATYAPTLLNAGQTVGITGETGLNFLSAFTQRLMRNATVKNPSEVAVMAEHGLGDITSPHYVKGFKNVGIDLKSFFDDKGHFKGEGGLEGLFALTKAMKSKGLDNPFKLGEAGFREQHTRVFWQELMRAMNAKDTDTDPQIGGDDETRRRGCG